MHIPIPRICEYVTLHGKRGICRCDKVKDSRWRGYRGLSEWADAITRVCVRGSRRVGMIEYETMNQKSERREDAVSGSEDGGRGHIPRNEGSL